MHIGLKALPCFVFEDSRSPQNGFRTCILKSLDANPLGRSFRMLNQRQDAIFYYFRDLYNPPVDVTESDEVPGFTQAGVSAKSPIISLAEPNEPTQIHMSLTNVSG